MSKKILRLKFNDYLNEYFFRHYWQIEIFFDYGAKLPLLAQSYILQ